MKIYKLSWQNPEEGSCMRWASSQEAAVKERMKVCEEHGVKRGDVSIDAVEIDTTKAGLIGWLNAQFTRDNG